MLVLGQFREEQKRAKGKQTKKLIHLRRQVARLRLEIAQEVKNLNLTERAKQRLIKAIQKVADEIRKAEREITKSEDKLEGKVSPADKKALTQKITEARAPNFRTCEQVSISPLK